MFLLHIQFGAIESWWLSFTPILLWLAELLLALHLSHLQPRNLAASTFTSSWTTIGAFFSYSTSTASSAQQAQHSKPRNPHACPNQKKPPHAQQTYGIPILGIPRLGTPNLGPRFCPHMVKFRDRTATFRGATLQCLQIFQIVHSPYAFRLAVVLSSHCLDRYFSCILLS